MYFIICVHGIVIVITDRAKNISCHNFLCTHLLGICNFNWIIGNILCFLSLILIRILLKCNVTIGMNTWSVILYWIMTTNIVENICCHCPDSCKVCAKPLNCGNQLVHTMLSLSVCNENLVSIVETTKLLEFCDTLLHSSVS